MYIPGQVRQNLYFKGLFAFSFSEQVTVSVTVYTVTLSTNRSLYEERRGVDVLYDTNPNCKHIFTYYKKQLVQSLLRSKILLKAIDLFVHSYVQVHYQSPQKQVGLMVCLRRNSFVCYVIWMKAITVHMMFYCSSYSMMIYWLYFFSKMPFISTYFFYYKRLVFLGRGPFL